MHSSLSPEVVIHKKALHFLSRREYSTHELRQKLLTRFPTNSELIDKILTQLQEQNYLRDHAFCEMLLGHRAQQGYGPRYIQQELHTHHLSLSTEQLSRQEVQEAFFQGFLAKFKRRYHSLPEQKLERAAIIDYFNARGYPRTLVHEYLERLEESSVSN